MLNSNSFGTVSSDIRKSIADFIKKLCSKRSNIYEYLISIYLFTYLKLLKWNLKQHMQRLLGPSKVSLHIFFEQSWYSWRYSWYLFTEDKIANKFILAILRGHIVDDVERKLMSLPTRYWGLAILIIKDVAAIEYANSRCITEELALPLTFKHEENKR